MAHVVGEKVRVLSASTLIGDRVYNPQGEHLGKIEELMIDLEAGCIAYAVLSLGGVLSIGDKLFPVPWQTLSMDTADKRLILNLPKQRLENAPGFDKDDWPDMSESGFANTVYGYYGYTPPWR